MKKILERKATTHGGRNGFINDTHSNLTLNLGKPEEMGGSKNSNTNPEELFSMGYSSCFASSIEFLLQTNHQSYDDIIVSVITSLIPDGSDGFKFSVEVDAKILGVDKEVEKTYIEKAYQFCPFSKAIQNNIDIAFI